MKKPSCILVFLLFVSFTSNAQDDKKTNVLTNTADVAKMALAKQKLYAGDNVSALNTFREVEQNNPDNGAVIYYVGLCYYNLGQTDKAKESLLKAAAAPRHVKPETHFLLGKIYQKEENFDKAIESFTTLKSSPNAEKESLQDGEILMSQCQNAKRMMSTPYDVTINNMGAGINSQYDDKNPCITADGSRMVLTSRRPNGADPAVDKEGDGMYFDDIYIARYDSAKGAYTKPELVSGSVNTKGHDACTSISADGKQIFIYRNDINDKKSYGGEIFVTKMNAGKWKTPEHMGKPISSTFWEGGACVSPDGKTYFFVSERKGGFGKSDIWTVQKINKKEWGEPVNLGPEINSASDEAGLFLAPDGKTLFFCSDNGNSMGGHDVFKTTLENGKWSAPQNLGYPINSPAKEGQISVSTDGRYAYISSERKGGLGGADIYKIDLKEYAILEKDNKRRSGGLSILKGTIREGGEGFGIADVDITVKNEAGELVTSAITNESGEYFMTLNAGAYTLNVQKKGYQAITEKIDVAKSEKETAILEKGYLLKK